MSTTTAGGATTVTNPFLAGNYGPVQDEVTLTELAVTGTIPEHLDGRYVRIGPNPMDVVDPQTHHWFVGDGMVHGVRLRGGRAEWYRNRWVRSSDVAERLGEPVPPGPRLTDVPDFASNTNVIVNAGRTLALVEGGGRPYELDDDLNTVGPCDFDGTLERGWVAHPHADPATGEQHAVSYFWGWGNVVRYTVLGTDGRIRKDVPIEVHGSPMMHDFSLTDRSVVIYDLPVRFDLDMAMADMRLPYRWDPEYPARIGVMPRDGAGSDVRWYDIDPCFVFHPMNAYEDRGSLVLDVARYPTMFDAAHIGPTGRPPTLDRWTIDVATGSVTEERIDDRGQEFPRVDERLTGRRHRYGYTVGGGNGSLADDITGAVLRHDLDERRTEVHRFGPGVTASEFVFVPAAPDAAEDDGVLMGYTHDLAAGTSALTLLDAQTLDTVGEVAIPVRIPYGFHGNWLPTP